MTSDCADGKYDVHNIVSPVPILAQGRMMHLVKPVQDNYDHVVRV